MFWIFAPIECIYFQLNSINSWFLVHFYENSISELLQLDSSSKNTHLSRSILLALNLLLDIQLKREKGSKKKQQLKATILTSWRTLFNCFHSLQHWHRLCSRHYFFSPNLDLINTRLLSRSMYSAITWAAR